MNWAFSGLNASLIELSMLAKWLAGLSWLTPCCWVDGDSVGMVPNLLGPGVLNGVLLWRPVLGDEAEAMSAAPLPSPLMKESKSISMISVESLNGSEFI